MWKCCETGPFTPYLEGLNRVYHQPSVALKNQQPSTVKKGYFLPSTIKMHTKINGKKVSRYFKFRYQFSWSSRNSSSWRIYKLENPVPMHVLKNTFSGQYNSKTCLYLKIFRNFIQVQGQENLQTQQLILISTESLSSGTPLIQSPMGPPKKLAVY